MRGGIVDFHQSNKLLKYTEWSSALGIILCFLSIGFIFLIFLTTSILPYILVGVFAILTIVCLVLAILGLKGPRPGLAKTSIAMSILAAGIFSYIAPLVLKGSPAREKYGDMEREFTNACQGQTYPDTRGYVTGVDTPIILAINPRDNFATANTVPGKYWPASLDEVNLIVCLSGEQEEAIQTCSYSNDKSFKRYQYIMEVVMISLKTGEKIAVGKLRGTEPDSCPPVVADDGFALPMYGEHAGSAEMGIWLDNIFTKP
jgi:hypothetical protein